jgi:hypothetical protein
MTFIFIIPILSIIGFIFNFFSIIVFSFIIKNGQRDDMYKHLLFKAICEMIGCFFSIFGGIYSLKGPLKYNFIMVVWFIYFACYIINALFMASIGFEVAAIFNCAISIEKRMKWCEKRLSFWLWVLIILILSFGVEIFPLFALYIEQFDEVDQFNRTIHGYDVFYNDLASKAGTFSLSESIIKDVLFFVILLSINCYILYKLIQIGRRKKRLTTNSSNVQNSNRAENRKILMILVLFTAFLFGHLPKFLIFAINNGNLSSIFWSYFTYFSKIFLNLSYSISFFVYFSFNNNFRHLFLKLIRIR